jgi:TonB family protein
MQRISDVLRRRVLASLTVAIFALGSYVALSGWAFPLTESDPLPRLRLSEPDLRSLVRRSVTPTYPAGSLRARAGGVAVARVNTDELGHVTAVSVLDAPDAAIKASVRQALHEWSFELKPKAIGRPYGVVGKLTFYFQIDGTQGRVLHSDQLARTDASSMFTGTAVRVNSPRP